MRPVHSPRTRCLPDLEFYLSNTRITWHQRNQHGIEIDSIWFLTLKAHSRYESVHPHVYLSCSLYHYYSDASFLARCATWNRRLCTSSLDLHARVLGFFSRFSFSVFQQIWPSPLHLYTYRLARDELENYARSRRIFFFWVNLPLIGRAASKSSVTPVRCRLFQRLYKDAFTSRMFFNDVALDS